MAKQQEIEDRKADREFQTKMKSAEFLHDAIKENEYIKIEHRKLNQKEQQAQSQQPKEIKGDV
jgi:hypothetical protein